MTESLFDDAGKVLSLERNGCVEVRNGWLGDACLVSSTMESKELSEASAGPGAGTAMVVVEHAFGEEVRFHPLRTNPAVPRHPEQMNPEINVLTILSNWNNLFPRSDLGAFIR
jgi:hypothetical protein